MSDEREFGAPPATPVQVGCIHCGRTFTSDQMRETDDGLWGCAFEDCDGRGFGVDVWQLAGDGQHEFTPESFREYFGAR